MKTSYRTTFLASLGSGLEYYDFVIYLMLAGTLSHVFFPAGQPFISNLEVLGIFGIGYLSRPLGGIIFGVLGDHFGRKTTFLCTILLMALSTGLMGLLPGYATLGIWSPILLLILRLLQGISQGGELAGGITFISEHATPRSRGLQCGLMMCGVGLGASLSTGIVALLSHTLSPAAFADYGFRIPFLLGAVLALVGFLLRRQTQETPLFLSAMRTKNPFMTVLKHYPLSLLQGIGIVLFPGCLIIFALYFPVYIPQYYPYSTVQIYMPLTISLIASAIFLPMAGWGSDQLSRKAWLLLANCLTLVCLFGLFGLLHTGSGWALQLFFLGYEGLIVLLAGAYPALLSELFPTPIRYTGIAICYNLTFCIAGFTPLFASVLTHHFNHENTVIYALLSLSALSIISLLTYRDKTHLPLP